MADTTPEIDPIPSGTENGQGVTTAEILEGFETPSPSATEEAMEALGSDIMLRLRSAFARGDIMLALGVVAILVILILPMPKWLLDVGLAFSITFSVSLNDRHFYG